MFTLVLTLGLTALVILAGISTLKLARQGYYARGRGSHNRRVPFKTTGGKYAYMTFTVLLMVFMAGLSLNQVVGAVTMRTETAQCHWQGGYKHYTKYSSYYVVYTTECGKFHWNASGFPVEPVHDGYYTFTYNASYGLFGRNTPDLVSYTPVPTTTG